MRKVKRTPEAMEREKQIRKQKVSLSAVRFAYKIWADSGDDKLLAYYLKEEARIILEIKILKGESGMTELELLQKEYNEVHARLGYNKNPNTIKAINSHLDKLSVKMNSLIQSESSNLKGEQNEEAK